MCIGQSIEWLNKNSGAMTVIFGAMTVIFSGLVALATLIYARLTGMMLREMRHTNERLEQPNVQAIFEAPPSCSPLSRLTIRNSGKVSVHDLTVTIDPPDFPGIFSYKLLKDISLFHRPIPVLCENQEISTPLFSFLEIKETPFIDSILTFKLSYKTPIGKTHHQSYSYDLAIYKELPYLIEKGIKDIVGPLEDIAKKLK